MFLTAHLQGFGHTDPVFLSSECFVASENLLESIVSWNSFPGIHPKLALFLIVSHYFFPFLPALIHFFTAANSCNTVSLAIFSVLL